MLAAQRTAPKAPAFTATLFEDAYQGLNLGLFPMQNSPLGEYHALPLPGPTGAWRVPTNHWSWSKEGRCFQVVPQGGGRAIETLGASAHYDNRLLVAGLCDWGDYEFHAEVTPLPLEAGASGSPAGGLCGLIARYTDSRTYLALVLDRDGQLKLLRRRENVFDVLAAAPLAHETGAALSFSFSVQGGRLIGRAGETVVQAAVDGYRRGGIGILADVPARFGPVQVRTSDAELARLKRERERASVQATRRIGKFPSMRLERTIPLHGLVNGRNLRIADINGDGKPEIILAQGSRTVADRFDLTRLTCLSVLDLDGKLLWQAGVPDTDAPIANGDLPFQVCDIDGDGKLEIVCVFGFDAQIRHGRTGKILWSAGTPETVPVPRDFKEVSSSWGSAWGDETLYMNVAQLAVTNLQGRPKAREILLKDDYHHLVVLDPFSDNAAILRHRGVHGHFPWIGDLDGDGHDELMAGYSLLDHDGSRKWSLHLQDHQDAIAIVDPLAPGGKHKRIVLCGGEDGLLMLGLNAEFHTRLEGHCQRLGVAKFRADLPGLQFATVTFWGNPGIFSLHDATGKNLWSKELPVAGGLAAPVNWTGRSEELLLYSMQPGAGLLNGHGDLCVEAPSSGPHACFDTCGAFGSDGRDALIAWDRESLAVYVPSDAPLKGARAKNVYRPQRSDGQNKSNYQAYVSLPPGW
ncbi:MAG: hypothetical protein HS116_07020 [Planctomycetes bacterium]|nr:hypothetical protein [Planctomycetota bacterium]